MKPAQTIEMLGDFQAKMTQPNFKEVLRYQISNIVEKQGWKNDKLKIISFYAKKARGLMVRYAIQNNIQDLEGILGFNLEGYAYSPDETKDPMTPVFVR